MPTPMSHRPRSCMPPNMPQDASAVEHPSSKDAESRIDVATYSAWSSWSRVTRAAFTAASAALLVSLVSSYGSIVLL